MNKQITEDYVSYDIAKLLREKGFKGKIHRWYTQYEEVAECTNIPHDYFDCPTLQMALKWLREMHHIFIQIELYSKYDDYWFEVFLNTHRIMMKKREVYNSYEEACEAAILYVLKKLI